MNSNQQEGIVAQIEGADQSIARTERMIKIATECGFELMANTLRYDLAAQKTWRDALVKARK